MVASVLVFIAYVDVTRKELHITLVWGGGGGGEGGGGGGGGGGGACDEAKCIDLG